MFLLPGAGWATAALAMLSACSSGTEYPDRQLGTAELQLDQACRGLLGAKLNQATVLEATPIGPGFVPPHGNDSNRGEGTIYVARAFCRISAEAALASGGRARFELWLPSIGWNGKYKPATSEDPSDTTAFVAMTTAVNSGYASWTSPAINASPAPTEQAVGTLVQAYYKRAPGKT